MRNAWAILPVLLAYPATGTAQAPQAVPLVETFSPTQVVRVTAESSLSGRLAIPQPMADPKVVAVVGSSRVEYDEKVLPTVGADTGRALRVYREVTFSRTLGDTEQKAEVRPSVRRMVVLRSGKAKKVPFSPDGPLTLNEIEVIRAELFSLALVPGLLPAKPVRPGDRWDVSDDAVRELTDYETVESNKLVGTLAGFVTLNGKRLAKLTVAGTVSGATADGPSRQTLSGLAYFDLDASRLTYLKVNGKSTLLGPKGVTTGEVAGTFTLRRVGVEPQDGLTPAALQGVALIPTDANTLLLFDDAGRGVRFRYPRSWRIGLTDGDRVTVQESNDAATLALTLSPWNGAVPAVGDVFTAAKAQAEKVGTLTAADAPKRTQAAPTVIDRFGLSVSAKIADKPARFRYEYAVIVAGKRGAVAKTRLDADNPAVAVLAAQAAAIGGSVEFFAPTQ